ncbi:MAG: cytochrome c [Opitutae bacterium]|nr:cytochrome c [Opitutae bacterium]
MNKTKQLLLTASLLAAATAAFAQSPDDAVVARGRYLVENVVGCADCHSARNQRGEIIPAQHLMGAPLPFAPTVPMPAWAAVSTPIVGLPGYTDEQAVTLFTKGLKPDGNMPRPPMPQFRLTEEDARAVVAYLRSLKK